MITGVEPLLNDAFVGEPAKRALSYIQAQREKGKKVVGTYCGYAPMEVIRAANAVPAVLCAFAHKTIEAAETVLPANLCPLIKSSYGFIKTDTCPFYSVSEAVIAETTCDGKKKMFELIAHIKPLHVMDLPQLPNEAEAAGNWTVMIRKLQAFLEETFGRKIADDDVEREIKATNEKTRLMERIFDFAAMKPSVITWQEIYDLVHMAMVSTTEDMRPLLQDAMAKLEKRAADRLRHGINGVPRIMVTGCPIGGDAQKVFNIIEEAGADIVALDACTGMKAFASTIEEDTADPYAAISRRYLRIPCSCMTPNDRRLSEMDRMIARFQPDAVVDVVLQACHSYNIESFKVAEHVQSKHGLPFLKIETDYSQGDVGQIRTRVEATLETIKR